MKATEQLEKWLNRLDVRVLKRITPNFWLCKFEPIDGKSYEFTLGWSDKQSDTYEYKGITGLGINNKMLDRNPDVIVVQQNDCHYFAWTLDLRLLPHRETLGAGGQLVTVFALSSFENDDLAAYKLLLRGRARQEKLSL